MIAALNWSSYEHWARHDRPCRYCQRPTRLRDSAGRPSHKTCAERHIPASPTPSDADPGRWTR